MARLLAYQDALDTPEAPWTVDGVLGGLGLLWGDAGVGKSFLAMSLAAAVATDRPWLGHRVNGGPVVYIVGEGGAGSAARRLDAAVTALQCCDADDEPTPLWLVTPGVDLVAGPMALLELLGGIRPELIVVDTLARCYAGDENSSQDMGRFVHTLDLLREVHGGSVLVIHHANKSDRMGSSRVRGSSVLYGAVDISMQLMHAGAGEMVLQADKLRDRDVSGPVAEFRFESVALATGETDELGDARTTRVVRPTASFAALLPEVASVPLRGVVDYATWREQCGRLSKGQFDRAVVAVLSDPKTWGVVEFMAGWYCSSSFRLTKEK